MAAEKKDHEIQFPDEYCNALADRLHTIIYDMTGNVGNDWPSRKEICSLLFDIQPNKCHEIVDIIGLEAPEYNLKGTKGFELIMDKFLAEQNIKSKTKQITKSLRETILRRWMPFFAMCCPIDQNKFNSKFIKLTQTLIAIFLKRTVPEIMIAYHGINSTQIISMDLCLIYQKNLQKKFWNNIDTKQAIYQTEKLKPQNYTPNALYEHCFGPEGSDLTRIIRQYVIKQNPNQYVVRIYVDLTDHENMNVLNFPAVVVEVKSLNVPDNTNKIDIDSKINNPLHPQTLQHVILARKRYIDDNNNEGNENNGISNGHIVISAVSYPTELFGKGQEYSYATKVYLQYNGAIRRFINNDAKLSQIINLIPKYFKGKEQCNDDSKDDNDGKDEDVVSIQSLTYEELQKIFDACDKNGRKYNKFYGDQDFNTFYGKFKLFEQKCKKRSKPN